MVAVRFARALHGSTALERRTLFASKAQGSDTDIYVGASSGYRSRNHGDVRLTPCLQILVEVYATRNQVYATNWAHREDSLSLAISLLSTSISPALALVRRFSSSSALASSVSPAATRSIISSADATCRAEKCQWGVYQRPLLI